MYPLVSSYHSQLLWIGGSAPRRVNRIRSPFAIREDETKDRAGPRAQGRGQRSQRDEETGPWQYWPIRLFRAGRLLSWGGAEPEKAVRRARAVQRCFLPHRGTPAARQGVTRRAAGWTRASTRLGEGEGGLFSLQGTPECLRFCRYRAPLSRARPHFSHQVKLG